MHENNFLMKNKLYDSKETKWEGWYLAQLANKVFDLIQIKRSTTKFGNTNSLLLNVHLHLVIPTSHC